jgi:hypothetical protein
MECICRFRRSGLAVRTWDLWNAGRRQVFPLDFVAAYQRGGYTLRQIEDYFSLHYSRISKIIHAAELAAHEEKGKT